VHTADAARGVEAAAVEQWLLHSGVLERTPLLSELRSTDAAAAATSDDEGDESDVWTGRGSSGRYDCGQSDCSPSLTTTLEGSSKACSLLSATVCSRARAVCATMSSNDLFVVQAAMCIHNAYVRTYILQHESCVHSKRCSSQPRLTVATLVP
jgi:hypothetical protein